jgi:catechol 2,3-dioxygenase-like lactoylglutathione lyase family enzyme
MQIKFAGVMVQDQEKALQFYTEILGFVKNQDIPTGQYRWLTVSWPDGIDGVELVLERVAVPPAREYQKAAFQAGLPATAFLTKDIAAEYLRLQNLGVVFRGVPKTMGPSPRSCLKTPVAA